MHLLPMRNRLLLASNQLVVALQGQLELDLVDCCDQESESTAQRLPRLGSPFFLKCRRPLQQRQRARKLLPQQKLQRGATAERLVPEFPKPFHGWIRIFL